MPIKFSCMYCGRQYKVEETHAGKTFECKQCSHKVKVPEPKQAAPASPKAGLGPEPNSAASPPPAKEIDYGRVNPPAQEGPGPASVSAPYGGTAQVREKDKKRPPNFVLIAASAVLMIGMLLPWVSPPDSVSESERDDWGYVPGIQLPFEVHGRRNAMRETGERMLKRRDLSESERQRILAEYDRETSGIYSLYALLLIPFMVMVALIDELRSAPNGANHWFLRLAMALSPVIAILVVLATALILAPPESGQALAEGSENELVGAGIWVALLGTVVGLVSVFTSPKAKPTDGHAVFAPADGTPTRTGVTTPTRPGAGVPNKPTGTPRLPARRKLPPRR